MRKGVIKACFPAVILIVAGVLAYWNSFDGVFVFDDATSIRDNPHIRVLWPLSKAMSLPLWSSAATVDGRPLLSLSFALNHAVFGPEPWGYHLVNLVIHICAGLLLFGVVRRTIRCQASGVRCQGGHETGIAFAVALIWLVHPLQTESVTYIVQRAESLMGMLFLMTLYCAVRGFQVSGVRCQGGGDRRNFRFAAPLLTQGQPVAPRAAQVSGLPLRCQHKVGQLCFALRRFSLWHVAAIVACATGMGVKQTMFSAPLLVLLYDGVFVSESFRKAVSKRCWFYAALFSTWLIVFGIIAATWQESTIDFVKISPIRYLFTQPRVLLHYMRLSVWPSPLVMEYGWLLEEQWHRIVLPGLAILTLLAVMFYGVCRRKWYGFVLAWFFLILAPTSSIAPMRQVIFEHRMYLSLAAAVLLIVLAGDRCLRRLVPVKGQVVLGGGLVLLVTIAFGCMTANRNRDYHSAAALWEDNIRHRPQSYIAHYSVGYARQQEGMTQQAIEHYRKALQIEPEYAETHNNLGNALLKLGRRDEAIKHYREALRLEPDYAEVHNNWGRALEKAGMWRAAIAHYRQALELDPRMARAHLNLGNTLHASGRMGEALGSFQAAIRVKPDYADAHNNLANVLLLRQQTEEAIRHYQEVLRLKPDHVDAHYGLGIALASQGKGPESRHHFEEVLRLAPDHTAAKRVLQDWRGNRDSQ